MSGDREVRGWMKFVRVRFRKGIETDDQGVIGTVDDEDEEDLSNNKYEIGIQCI